MALFTKEQLDQIRSQNLINMNTPVQKQEAPKTSGRGGFLTSLISEAGGTGGALGGAALGASLGSVVPGVGTLIGGIAGGALGGLAGGGAGAALEQQVRDDEIRAGDVLQEALISGAFGAAGGVGRGLQAAKGAKLAGEGAEAVAKTGAKKSVLTGARNAVDDKAAAQFLNLTPAQTTKLLNEGVDPVKLAKRAADFGDDAVSIIGRTGNKGPLQSTIKALEDGIQGTAKTLGNNVRIDSTDIIKALKAQRKELAKSLGSDSKVKALDKIIADATKKYSKGVSAKQALSTLRTANSKFGASILDDTTEAVAKSAQKLEANALREALKTRFPGIKNALDSQSELINLREILKTTRGRSLSGKASLGSFDFTRPGTFANPILKNNKVNASVLRAGNKTAQAGGGAAQAAASTADDFLGRAGQNLTQNFRVGSPSNIGKGLGATRALAPGMIGRGVTSQEAPMETADPELEQILMEMQSGGAGTQGGMQGDALQGQTQGGSPYTREALLYDMQRDPSNAQDYLDYYTQLQDVFAPAGGGLELSNTAIQDITDLQTGIDNLGGIEQRVAESSANAPLLGELRSRNPFDTEAASLRAELDRVKQVVGKALEGGVLRKEDEEKYKRILPTVNDTDAVAQQKINAIRADLQNKLNTYLANQQQFGGGGGMTDVLMQMQTQGVY